MRRIYFVLFAMSWVCFSCGHKQREAAKESNAIPDSLIHQVQTAEAVLGDEGGFVKLNGKVVPDEAKEAKVFALASGKIQSMQIELGDLVHKGQVLAVLKSAEVAGVSNEVSMASADVSVAEKGMRRTKELYEGGLATEQEYLEVEGTYKKALSELKRAKQVAAITGANNASYVISAPIGGFVIEKNVTNNSEVRSDNSDVLFTIADISKVWIMANVYEADMSRIHLGDSVVVNTLVDPEKNYGGKIDKVYNVLDPATRTMQVRISMDNPNNELKPELFVTVRVSERSADKGVTIPAQAIVMEHSKNYVVVKATNRLEVKEIQLLKRVEGKAFVRGLSLGDQVVINSQVFLYQALTSN